MSSIIRGALVHEATGVVALGAASLAGAAGVAGDAIEKLRDRAEERAQSEPQRAPIPQRGAGAPAPARRGLRQHPRRRIAPQTCRTSRLSNVAAPEHGAPTPVVQAPANRGKDIPAIVRQ